MRCCHPNGTKALDVRWNYSGLALILTFSPWEKEKQARGSGVAKERPANPVASFCGWTVNDSPSGGLSRHSRQATAEGEGRGEVGPRRILSHPTRGFDLLAACFIHCA